MDIRLALVGENIGYTKSPAIFEAIFRSEGIDGRFDVCQSSAGSLAETVQKLATSGYRGFSVTIPHKERIIDRLGEIDVAARVIGAVNCVSIDSGKLTGYNTDWSGLVRALESDPEIPSLSDGRVLIAGTGGAARAVIYTLNRAYGQTQFLVLSRNPDRVESLNQHFHNVAQPVVCTHVKASSISSLGNLRAIFNCTPLGGPNRVDESPFPDDLFTSDVHLHYDLNYNIDNPLVKRAAEMGIIARDGSSMLVWQALEAFKIWTGREVEFQPLYSTVFGGNDAR